MSDAKTLKIIRAVKNISQQELATLTSISKSLISRIESGERSLTNANLNTIASKLNIPKNVLKLLRYSYAENKKISEEEMLIISKSLLRLIHEESVTYENPA